MKWAILATLIGLIGCRGRIAYRDTEREVVVHQPTDPKDAGTVTIGPDGTVSVVTSGEHSPPSATETITVKSMMVFGALFAVAAVGLVIARAKFPLIPSNAPMGCGIAAAACFTLPTIIQAYKLPIAIGAGVWIAWTIYSYRHNGKLHAAVPRNEHEVS